MEEIHVSSLRIASSSESFGNKGLALKLQMSSWATARKNERSRARLDEGLGMRSRRKQRGAR
eukprot:767773-Hanusia_phi.AAC.7